MRLIDADKLIKDVMELWDYKTVDGITATTVLKQTITDIENQLTVKAIPVDWLHSIMEKQIIFAMNSDGNIYFISAAIVRQVLENVIELWEKENETN